MSMPTLGAEALICLLTDKIDTELLDAAGKSLINKNKRTERSKESAGELTCKTRSAAQGDSQHGSWI